MMIRRRNASSSSSSLRDSCCSASCSQKSTTTTTTTLSSLSGSTIATTPPPNSNSSGNNSGNNHGEAVYLSPPYLHHLQFSAETTTHTVAHPNNNSFLDDEEPVPIAVYRHSPYNFAVLAASLPEEDLASSSVAAQSTQPQDGKPLEEEEEEKQLAESSSRSAPVLSVAHYDEQPLLPAASPSRLTQENEKETGEKSDESATTKTQQLRVNNNVPAEAVNTEKKKKRADPPVGPRYSHSPYQRLTPEPRVVVSPPPSAPASTAGRKLSATSSSTASSLSVAPATPPAAAVLRPTTAPHYHSVPSLSSFAFSSRSPVLRADGKAQSLPDFFPPRWPNMGPESVDDEDLRVVPARRRLGRRGGGARSDPSSTPHRQLHSSPPSSASPTATHSPTPSDSSENSNAPPASSSLAVFRDHHGAAPSATASSVVSITPADDVGVVGPSPPPPPPPPPAYDAIFPQLPAHSFFLTERSRITDEADVEAALKICAFKEDLFPHLGFIPLPEEEELRRLPLPGVHHVAPARGFVPDVKTPHVVFFGQLRFEVTTRQLSWLVMHLTQGLCVPLSVHHRNVGCFTACFGSAEEAARLRTFHERLLCDRGGMWIARTDDERRKLHHFIDTKKPRVFGLPRGAVIIRE